MIFISHRINKIADIHRLEKSWGAELDLRACPESFGKIHVSHEAWEMGDDFEQWLREFKKQGATGPLILNTKEDGLEQRVLDLIHQVGISNYFFLDTALPTLVKRTVQLKEKHYAVRYSSYEPMEFVEKFKGLCDWVWIDCFQLKPISPEEIKLLAQHFKTCLVSPELQGGDLKLISDFKKLYSEGHLTAVCTKRPDLWSHS